ncbi:AAA family ATPase [Streptomyces sp. NPDC000963]
MLWERDELLGTAAAAGEAARAGNGRWMQVTGAVPGTGRTALLDEVVRRQTADGMRVEHARGTPEEAAFPYGLVRRLFTEDIGGVPFVTPTGHGEQRLYHRLVTRLARLATERPVLLAVDDLHHADEPSRHWIGYLARRIAELPVLLVTTTCAGYTDPPVFPADTGTSAELRPLSAPAVVRIARAAGLSTQETTTCVEAGAGNPALVHALVADLRDGPLPRSSPTSVRSRYRETITGWIRSLPDPRSRHDCLALAVTAEGGTTPGLTDRVTGLLPTRPAPGSPSMGHRLGTLLSHPLAREAVLAAAEPEELAALHTHVAQVLAEEGAPATDVAARLLHVDRPGEAWMVRSLEEAADEALRAGRPAESAGYLRHALRGPLAPDRRAGLAMRLGALELPGNVTAGIRWLHTGLELHTDLRERASAASALSAGLVAGRDPDAALRILHQVGRAAADDELVHVLQALAALVSSHDAEAWRDAVSALRALAPVAPPTIEPLVCGLITEYEAGAGLCSAAEAVARVERRLGAPVDQRLRTAWLGSAATLLQWADRLEEARALAARCLPSSPVPPDLTDMGLQCMLSVRAEAALWAGEFGRVIDENVAWVELSAEQGVRLPHLAAMVALARSEIGARAEAWEAVTVAGPSGADTSWEWNELGYARARLHEADGDWRAALEGHLACGAGQNARDFVSPVATPWRSGAALALARLGRREEARELAEEELRHARTWGTGRTIGRALRAHAAALGGRLALESLTEAAELLGSAPAPVELVETLVDLGRARLDAGNGRKGRDTLREAHAVALRLAAQKPGARRLLDLTEEALRRGGARKTSGGQALTAAERRVAELAAAGHTNARISSSLCLTRRTVEMHLTNAYRKLRIARRTQLVAVLAREAGPVGE